MEKITFGNNALKFGLYLAAFNIVLTLVYYIFDISMFDYSTMIANFVFGILFVVSFFVFGIKSYRQNALDGIINFKQAFLQGLAIGVVAYAVIAVFNYVFNAFIAPEFMANQLEGFAEFMENTGAPDETIDAAISDFEENLPPVNQLLSTLKSGGIMTVIFSLIVAASVKKDTTQPKI